MAKSIGFNLDEMSMMTIGDMLDQIEEYVEAHDQEKDHNNAERPATQADFDGF
ncbi:hypothetical protein [Lacticaseibacillus paracasei]|nr:hypothetical protein [Lacticaseibacillus paracasei]